MRYIISKKALREASKEMIAYHQTLTTKYRCNHCSEDILILNESYDKAKDKELTQKVRILINLYNLERANEKTQ